MHKQIEENLTKFCRNPSLSFALANKNLIRHIIKICNYITDSITTNIKTSPFCDAQQLGGLRKPLLKLTSYEKRDSQLIGLMLKAIVIFASLPSRLAITGLITLTSQQ